MDRRSFLRSLAALPVVAFLGAKPIREPKPTKGSLDMPFRSFGYADYGQLDQPFTAGGFLGPGFLGPGLTRQSGWQQLSGGYNWWLGLKAGVPWHWGNNTNGQRGDGTTGPSDINSDIPPQAVPGLSNIVQIATGRDFALALDNAGVLSGWGFRYGLGGTSGIGNQTTPITVMTGVAQIAAGDDFAIAVKNDNTVWFAGDGWVRGDGTSLSSGGVWLQIPGLTGPFSQICAGFKNGIFLRASDNRAFGLGANASGELGLGTTSSVYTLTDLGCNPTWVASGGDSVLWIIGGVLYFSGDDFYGQSGQGTHGGEYHTRVSISLGGETPTKAWISRQYRGAGALTSARNWWAWGRNESGYFGSQTTVTTPPFPDNAYRLSPVLCESGLADVWAGDFSVIGKTPSNARSWVFVAGL